MKNEAPATELSDEAVSLALPRALLFRFGGLAALLALEWIPLSARIDTGHGGRFVGRVLAALFCLLLGFGYSKLRQSLARVSRQIEGTAVAWEYLLGHFGMLVAFVAISQISTGKGGRFVEAVIATFWYGAAFSEILLAGFAFLPPRHWFSLLKGTRWLWLFAMLAAFAAFALIGPLQSAWNDSLWKPAIDATFNLTAMLLKPFLPGMVEDRTRLLMGSSRFAVIIEAGCSGIEGAGLMLVFVLGWLWFFRHECRFPHVLLLIPVSIAVMWFLNAARIATLILIGNAGFPDVAMGGFHSQAGWISFNLVAVSVSLAAGRIPWWKNLRAAPLSQAGTFDNPTTWYLMPFVAILAATMISRAASGAFEWFYPMRLVAAAAALWAFRSKYAALNWRVSYFAPVIGTLVFGIWIVLEPAGGANKRDTFAATLSASPVFVRTGWLVCRTLAAITTVPIAEELAFRGFLIRRLIAVDFDSMNARSWSYAAVLVSSLAFGLLHGERWVAGTLAGALYAAAFLRKGSFADAVVAHATSNAMLAGMVLLGGKWYLW
jgi:exosortase E/protease (VPEID-CTERM system)